MGIFALMGKMISGMQTDVEGHVSNVYIKNTPDDFTEFVKNTDFFNNAYITFIDSSRDTSVYENAIKAGDKSCDLLVVFDLDFNGLVDSYKEKGDQIPEISVTYNANADYSAGEKLSPLECLLRGKYDAWCHRLGQVAQKRAHHPPTQNQIEYHACVHVSAYDRQWYSPISLALVGPD